MSDIHRALLAKAIEDQQKHFAKLSTALKNKYSKKGFHHIPVVVKYPFGVLVMHECMFDIIRVLVVNPSMTSLQISDSTTAIATCMKFVLISARWMLKC